ncbi:MAG: type II secretion system major pseudopilin GspG [Pirellula sp.]|jgi:general secretion pathway protein G
MSFLNHRLSCFGRHRFRKAFTLVELMVVLVILALLTGVVTINIRGYLLRSKQQIAKIEIGKIIEALESFNAAFDRYPTNQESIAVLTQQSNEFPEGILTFLPTDPWGQAYDYRCPGTNDPYEIVCFGADRREGGSDGDRDITSMELKRARKASL